VSNGTYDLVHNVADTESAASIGLISNAMNLVRGTTLLDEVHFYAHGAFEALRSPPSLTFMHTYNV
jgi:hypothetical protein